jgi:HEAT repeat protein
VAAALEEVGPPSESRLNDLVQLLDDTPSDVQYWAVTLLGRAGAAAAGAVEAIARLLRDSSDLATRERAAWALGKIGSAAMIAAPALHVAAASTEPRLSRLATSALAEIADK